MKQSEIEKFTKQKRRERRILMDEKKELSRQKLRNWHGKEMHTATLEKYLYDAQYFGK